MNEINPTIPKIIHYCWFGRNPLPELAKKCIASWKKFMPDYEIKEWNEDNYDVRKITYIAQAYDAKKYAFVSDFARFDILYEHGGVYFDTDVEVIKPLDDILRRGSFAGVERTGDAGSLAAGLGIASPAASEIYKEILASYKESSFIKADGSLDLTTVVTRVSNIFKKHGLKDVDEIQKVCGVTVYPAEYFCPKNFETGELTITENTRTIHWFDGSWLDEYNKQLDKQVKKIYKKYGNNFFSKIMIIFYGIGKRFHTFGLKKAIKYYYKRTIK